MREEDSNWFSRWEEELPSPEELMPLSQTLITPDLALAFDIRNPNPNNSNNNNNNNTNISNNNNNNNSPTHYHHQQTGSVAVNPLGNTTTSASTPPPQPNSAEFGADSADLGSGAAGEEPARTLKRPRLVWTPQLHKRFVDAVAHLGIKNAVPKTIMQLMSVDGLTRENVASHLQKYRLYLKRMQGVSAGGGGSGPANGAGGLAAASADPATDHLFASSPVPPHFLHPGRPNSDHFLPFVQVAALPHHHHHHPQQMVATVAHPQLQPPFHRQVGHFGSPPNGQFEHPFLSTRQSQPVHRMAPLHNQGPGGGGGYGEELELANGAGGRKVLTLFPTGDD